MRRAITAFSLMLFGTSIMIFISAPWLSSLRASISHEGITETEVHQSSASFKKTIENSAPQETQSPAVINQPEPAIIEAEGKVGENPATGPSAPIQLAGAADLPRIVTANDNTVDKSLGNSSAMRTLPSSPESTASRIDKKSPEPVNPISAEKKHSGQHEPMSLLVLGEGSFTPGEAKPKAEARTAIDQIIPLIQTRPLDKVIVEGHADKSVPDGFSPEQGSKWNKIISTLRAKSIAEVLKQKGVASGRINFIGLGDAVPLASNLTYAGRSKNRRVEIKLLPSRQ